MATKKTTKTTKRKAVSKTKKTEPIKEENPYTLLMVIASAIILLILIVPKSNVNNNSTIKTTSSEIIESEDKTIEIGGEFYKSKEEAYKLLKDIPQTRRTDEETIFVESYKLEK
tara:strand:- start:1010 stop:1351 length:342 start_codon:yes stop_codon:yes gene_type:complete